MPRTPCSGAWPRGWRPLAGSGGTGRFAGATGEFIAYMRGILHFTQPMELTWAINGEVGY
jgi:hypothetical protein